MSLSNEQLKELTERINERVREFDFGLPRISRGLVRIAHEVIMEFWHPEGSREDDAHAMPLPVAPSVLPTRTEVQALVYETMEDVFTEFAAAGNPLGAVDGLRPASGDEPTPAEPTPDPPPEPPATYTNGNHAADEDAFAAEIHAAGVAAKVAAEAVIERAVPRPATARTLADVDATAQREAAKIEERNAQMREIIEAMRAMATDGKMPSIMQWDMDRPEGMPKWANIQNRHNVTSWRKMAALCGLEYAPACGPGFAAKEETTKDDTEMSGTGYKRTPEQLERLRRRRAQARKEEKARKPTKPPTRREPSRRGSFVAVGDTEPTKPTLTRDEVIAEVQRQAMGGVMVTMAQFDTSKPAVWPTAAALVLRFNTTWRNLAEESGLKWERAPRRVDGELQPAG